MAIRSKKYKDNLFKSGINKITNWIHSKKWNIIFGDYKDAIFYEDKLIKINKRFY